MRKISVHPLLGATRAGRTDPITCSGGESGMPKDPSPTNSTPVPGTPSAASAAPASATERAQEMRTRLGAQREAEEMLAEASTLRRTAAGEAETIVAEAESLATQLVTEAREA